MMGRKKNAIGTAIGSRQLGWQERNGSKKVRDGPMTSSTANEDALNRGIPRQPAISFSDFRFPVHESLLSILHRI